MIHDLKPYPAMKDSGVPWLGQVPEHWDVKRGKNFFRVIDIRSRTGEEELLTVSSDRGVIPRSTANVTMFQAESYKGHKLCWPDDLVINSLWAWSRGLGVAQHHGIISTAYSVYRLRDKAKVLPQYINILVRSSPFQWELQVRSKGIWISRLQLTDDSFLDAPFPLPEPDEQAAIVRFLEHADRRIRKTIAAKQKLIKLLQEQKQVIIHQAVTRGLDPNVKLKPSGVEWLGDVPEGWEIKRGKNLFRQTELPITPEDEIVTCFRDGQVTLRRLRRSTGYMVALKEGGYQGVQEGQLVIHAMDAFAGAIGVAEASGKCTPEYIVLTGKHDVASNRYFAHALRIAALKGYISMICSAVRERAPRFRYPTFSDMYLPVPSAAEQMAITEHISEITAELTRSIELAIRERELLMEYRTRLIADVVTGKLDVREAAARLPEPDAEALPEELDVGEDEGLEGDGDEPRGGEEV